MLFFLDTEFTSLGKKPDLISLALVGDGGEFYAERTDYPDLNCSDFLRQNVLPQLGLVAVQEHAALLRCVIRISRVLDLSAEVAGIRGR